MTRKIEDLEASALKFWPTTLSQREQAASIIPKLLESQEKFIGILYIADKTPSAWTAALTLTNSMPANLFLQHLVVLSDMGGEPLKRCRANIQSFFPNGTMTYRWKDNKHSHTFRSLATCKAWTNKALGIGAAISKPMPLSPLLEDVGMFLIHSGTSIDVGLPDVLSEKCIVGSLVGRKRELDTFVRQRYIHVSRITRGATANRMGQLCQAYVRERLQSILPDWDFSRHTIPGISHNAGRTDMSFDLVARSPRGTCCAIEVSFQVTTNSVIERKAGQADSRLRLLREAGHKIAYVIDGAGNFDRRSAISTICQYSDCVVSFKDEELESLGSFLKKIK